MSCPSKMFISILILVSYIMSGLYKVKMSLTLSIVFSFFNDDNLAQPRTTFSPIFT
jgi:hypothetical protein